MLPGFLSSSLFFSSSPPVGSRRSTARLASCAGWASTVSEAFRLGSRLFSDVPPKLVELVESVLPFAPLADLSEIDLLAASDVDRHVETLAIVPVVKSCEAVAARIRRREGPRPSSLAAKRRRTNLVVPTDGQRPARELHPELGIRMNISISASAETDVTERPVQRLLSRLARKHEIEIKRSVCARGMNRGAGSAGQDGRDAVPVQSCPYCQGDFSEGPLPGDRHRGFPVRRGRRRSVATARWRSASASASLARYVASSRLAR